jgi:hypothetical protein
MMKKVSEGHSPHVVGMLGCVTLQEPLCLVTEFVKYGDLLSYLRTNRKMVCASTNARFTLHTSNRYRVAMVATPLTHIHTHTHT